VKDLGEPLLHSALQLVLSEHLICQSNLLGVVRVVNRIVKHVYVEVFGVENGLVEICLTLYQLEFSLQNKVEFGYF